MVGGKIEKLNKSEGLAQRRTAFARKVSFEGTSVVIFFGD